MLALLRNKLLAIIAHQIAKILAVAVDLLSVEPQIVTIGARPVKEMRVIVDAALHMPKGKVKALSIRLCLRQMAEVPLADVRSAIVRFMEHVSNRNFAVWQALGPLIARHITGDASSRRKATSH